MSCIQLAIYRKLKMDNDHDLGTGIANIKI